MVALHSWRSGHGQVAICPSYRLPSRDGGHAAAGERPVVLLRRRKREADRRCVPGSAFATRPAWSSTRRTPSCTDRRDATRSWEFTQVNEMLTLDGESPAALHLHDEPDGPARPGIAAPLHAEAAIRPLTPAQSALAFERFFGIGAPRATRRRLNPGDFAAVRRKRDLFGDATAVALADWLDEEVEAKGTPARAIGSPTAAGERQAFPTLNPVARFSAVLWNTSCRKHRRRHKSKRLPSRRGRSYHQGRLCDTRKPRRSFGSLSTCRVRPKDCRSRTSGGTSRASR